LRSKILDFYPKKGIYSALKYSKIDALHHVVATPLQDDCKTTAVPIGDEAEQKRGFNYFKPENLGAIDPM
jgi:hypothetical protein